MKDKHDTHKIFCTNKKLNSYTSGYNICIAKNCVIPAMWFSLRLLCTPNEPRACMIIIINILIQRPLYRSYTYINICVSLYMYVTIWMMLMMMGSIVQANNKTSSVYKILLSVQQPVSRVCAFFAKIKFMICFHCCLYYYYYYIKKHV